MKKHMGCIHALAILVGFLLSCSPSQEAIAEKLRGTLSAWTVPPTYTHHPTYTVPPTTVREVTRIVVVTATDEPTSIYSVTMTPTKTPPEILAAGTGRLKAIPNEDSIPMSYFDLDTGKNGDATASDINFYETCGSGCFPVAAPSNGAIGFIFGRHEPSYEDCAENMFDDSFDMSYQFVCIQTNSGNISMFKIILDCWNSGDETQTITFVYKTWKPPEK